MYLTTFKLYIHHIFFVKVRHSVASGEKGGSKSACCTTCMDILNCIISLQCSIPYCGKHFDYKVSQGGGTQVESKTPGDRQDLSHTHKQARI